MKPEIVEVRSRRERREFVNLPYRLYRDDINYVPILRTQSRGLIDPRQNPQLKRGPHILLLAMRDGHTVGRVLAGVDLPYNQLNQVRTAWFSLFECERDDEAASALLEAVQAWASRQGCDTLRGPESPDGSDSFRGILVFGFDGRPAFLNNYNPPWYDDFFAKAGFAKYLDLFAYWFSARQIIDAKKEQVIDYAMHRYDYRVDSLDLNELPRDLHDIHTILVQTVPLFEGERMSTPSFKDVENMAAGMLKIVDPDLVCIARTCSEGRPIGLVVALPDYNQVFRHLRDGRLIPFGYFKLLHYRNKIDSARVFMQFVVQEYQGKAVNNACFYRMCRLGIAKGYVSGDGSAIGETNMQSRASIERLGGKHYRTYRIYRKTWECQSINEEVLQDAH